MTTISYYLQSGPDGREFIADELQKDCKLIQECQARSWREAKEHFCYDPYAVKEPANPWQ